MVMRRKREKTVNSKKREEELGPRKRSRFLEGVTDVDPRNYELLRKFVTEHGRIIPSRITGATAKQQRQIKRAVRRARVMGMIP